MFLFVFLLHQKKMGCGSSSDIINTSLPMSMVRSIKSTCLVFGMPDSGQETFVTAIEKCFASISAMKELPFEFYVASTDRLDRVTWIDEYQKHSRIIISFFFADISSKASILASVRTLNWLRCEIPPKTNLFAIVLINNDKDIEAVNYLKSLLGDSIEFSTFNEDNPNDVRIYVEHIIGLVAQQSRYSSLFK